MSTIAPVSRPTEPNAPTPGPGVALIRNWKTPVALGIFALLAVLLLVVFGRDGVSTMRLSTSSDLIQLPDVELPTRETGIVISVLLLAIAAYSAWLVYNHK